MPGTLYLVGTPIGNLGDLTPRAAETLRTVDFIAAEDTRVTRKLLTHLETRKPLIRYCAHTEREQGAAIVQKLQMGENGALVTDAGMPAISDPGAALVALCAEHDIPVQVIPGPSAVVAGLALSGFLTGRFTFEGFLSTARRSRTEHLASLRTEGRTIVFFEAPHKLPATLADMLATFGDRRIVLARELTKRYEETIRTTLRDAAARYSTEKPRGEYVLIIEGAAAEPKTDNLDAAVARLHELLTSNISVKDAVRQCNAETGVARNVLYPIAIEAND